MEQEQLKIFDRYRNQIGVASRTEVHRIGYWHEAFQCWFVGRENDRDIVFLQIRSETKKDYPNLLDITAAGHLSADETVRDGVREIEEEIGIDLSFHELIPLGVIEYCVTKKNFIDKELANVFLYQSDHSLDDFILQREEVSGMVKADLNEFAELWSGKRQAIRIEGFENKTDGNKASIDKMAGRDEFVPHPVSYYETVIKRIKERMND
ncbi:NUDIX hydrolase [Bacillus marinisedimentorum]|uniref:NUDIX hydrolase n=1 Tax=Bacillus marinisedimentorum TaxID=1821260 RepID=UPI0007E1B594|nr:NUDIX domain-containing protein [Bacillus marinisedimentorum]